MPLLKLSRSTGRDIVDPTEQQLLEALGELDIKDGFLILGSAEEEYVQAAGACLEYRDSTGHYRAGNGDSDRQTIRNVLIAYSRGRADWKSLAPNWTNVTEELARESSANPQSLKGIWGLVLLVVVVTSILFWNWLKR